MVCHSVWVCSCSPLQLAMPFGWGGSVRWWYRALAELILSPNKHPPGLALPYALLLSNLYRIGENHLLRV